MPGQICLVGGEEFRVGCEEMDREIMAASGGGPARVVVIPTAAVTGPAKAANDGVTHFAKLGGDASQLMVLEREHADDAAFVLPSREADVVYFTGGSPDHLLATVKDSQLWTALLETMNRDGRDLVLAGSSAGAMVMGSMMRRPRAGGWVEGLGLVPGIAVMAHHENRDPEETSRELEREGPSGLTVLGIDARTGCLGRPGAWKVVGSGKVTVYQEGEWGVFESGQRLPSSV
jgi:cyanophycinase-like exopeptidase